MLEVHQEEQKGSIRLHTFCGKKKDNRYNSMCNTNMVTSFARCDKNRFALHKVLKSQSYSYRSTKWDNPQCIVLNLFQVFNPKSNRKERRHDICARYNHDLGHVLGPAVVRWGWSWLPVPGFKSLLPGLVQHRASSYWGTSCDLGWYNGQLFLWTLVNFNKGESLVIHWTEQVLKHHI